MSIRAITPIDGRYATHTSDLVEYFSEFALIKFRVQVEIEYFIALSEIPISRLSGISENQKAKLRDVYLKFSESDAELVKKFESVTNHDVKAVEYLVKEKLNALGLEKHAEFVHFGLTSQDINNTAVPVSVRTCLDDVYFPALNEITVSLENLSKQWRDTPM